MPTLTREELYDLVWKDALRAVAPTLGVSDVWLKKCCKVADIPIPERGHWNKVHAGKAVIVQKLPPRPPGVPNTIAIGKEPYRSNWPYKPERELAEPEPVKPEFPEQIEEVEARVAKLVGKAKLYRDLDAPHPLVRHVLEEDEKRRTKPKGIPYRLQWSQPLFDSPFEQRRLRLLNSLFLAFAKAGYKCWLSDEDARSTGVCVGSQRISFLLDHPSAKQDRDYRYRTRQGGVDTLQLKLATDKGWIDKPSDKLESRLTEIVVQTITYGEVCLRAGAEYAFAKAWEHRREMEALLQKQKEEAERRELERRLKAERERRNGLLRMARDLRKANEIRALVAEIQHARGMDPRKAEKVEKWARWATEVADRTDPLMRLRFNDRGESVLDPIELPEAGRRQAE